MSLNITKLILAAEHYASHNPALAAFYMQEAEVFKKSEGFPVTPKHLMCQFCGSIFRPENHSTWIVPRMKVSNKMRHLTEKAEKGGLLGRFQAKLAELYTKRQNRVVILCLTCNHRTVLGCQDTRKMKAADTKPADTATPVELTRAEKRKLKKKLMQKAKKEKQSQSSLESSGLDLNLNPMTPKFTSTPIGSSTFNSRPDLLNNEPVHMISLNETPDVTSLRSMNIGAPKRSSTPKSTALHVVQMCNTRGVSTPRMALTKPNTPQIASKQLGSSLVISTNNSTLNTSTVSKSKKKAEKKKANQSVLQKMLAKEKDEQDSTKSSSLQDFLLSMTQ